jgi:hypothetical protein
MAILWVSLFVVFFSEAAAETVEYTLTIKKETVRVTENLRRYAINGGVPGPCFDFARVTSHASM